MNFEHNSKPVSDVNKLFFLKFKAASFAEEQNSVHCLLNGPCLHNKSTRKMDLHLK